MLVYKRKAHYHEVDKMGVVHHSNYVKWMEEARIEAVAEFGISFKEAEENGILSPIVNISVDYKRPVAFGDEVEIRVTILKYTGAVMELGYEFYNLTAGCLCTVATSRNCFVVGGRVTSLKKAAPEADAKLRAIYEAQQTEAAAGRGE
jgi:acyl-CoA thioester hydrolase